MLFYQGGDYLAGLHDIFNEGLQHGSFAQWKAKGLHVPDQSPFAMTHSGERLYRMRKNIHRIICGEWPA